MSKHQPSAGFLARHDPQAFDEVIADLGRPLKIIRHKLPPNVKAGDFVEINGVVFLKSYAEEWTEATIKKLN